MAGQEIETDLKSGLKSTKIVKHKGKCGKKNVSLVSNTGEEVEPKTSKKGRHSRDRLFVGRSSRSMFSSLEFQERHDLEQYFWTQKTIDGILSAVSLTFDYDPEEDCCCLCTPSLAHTWWVGDESKEVSLLDIDTRFKYLPKFRYFDLRDPTISKPPPEDESESSDSGCNSSESSDVEVEASQPKPLSEENSNWRLIIFDPPFFYIPMQTLYDAVLYLCGDNVKSTKILIGFLKREERILLETFKEFNLKRTNFPLEYAHVKSNKWANYAMYSNVDLPGIKRMST